MNESTTFSRSDLARFEPLTTWDAIRPPVAVQTGAIGLTAE